MRRATEQQMLEWSPVTPSRPVGIDLTERGRDAERPAGGRLAEGAENKGVRKTVAIDLTGREAGDKSDSDTGVRRLGVEPRFHLERLTRELVVDEIIALNPTATVRFLSEFDDDGLRLYLGRLRSTQLGRGRATMSDRPAGRSAISAHMRTN